MNSQQEEQALEQEIEDLFNSNDTYCVCQE